MTDPLGAVTDGIDHLTHLIDVFSGLYDQLYSQDLDIDDLGHTLDSMIYARARLEEQKIKLEAQRTDLRSKITSSYGDQSWENGKKAHQG